MNHNELMKLINNEELEVVELPMESKIKGLYADNVIAINKNIDTTIEKSCILLRVYMGIHI